MRDTDTDQMMGMITGYWISQIVHTTAKFSIADHLSNGPATAEEIAGAEGTHPTATSRLLRACESLGMAKRDSESKFVGTPLLDTLRRDVPGSLRGLALAWPASGHWLPWGRLPEAIRTGRNQSGPALGMGLFDYLTTNEEEQAAFSEAMQSLTWAVAREVADLIETSKVKTVVDVGGATGAMLCALLQARPDLRGILFDRPHVVSSAVAAITNAGLETRATAIGGSFFESVPEADLYLLKHILHDWDDDSCARILRNCRRSLRPGGKIAVIEMLLSDNENHGMTALFDLTMLVVLTGRERTLQEYRQLLEAAGLQVDNVIPMKKSMAIIEAVPKP